MLRKFYATLLILAYVNYAYAEEIKAHKHFALGSFLENQIKHFDKLKPILERKTRIASKDTTKNFIPSKEEWYKELYIFIREDMNEEFIKSTYDISEENEETFFVRTYQKKEGKNPTIQVMNVTYEKFTEQIIKIELVVRDKSFIYHSERKLDLIFGKKGDMNVLTGYIINGKQNILSIPSTQYYVEGKISYPRLEEVKKEETNEEELTYDKTIL